jgi:hypothetical protein
MRYKTFLLAIFAVITSILLAPAIKADQWDKGTVLTIGQSIQIPHRVLQPGTYVMRLLDSSWDRHIVQVFDKNGQHLITTVLAIPNYRLEPTGKSAFTFWETPAGQPPALRAWFYPGDNYGQEFVYPKGVLMQLTSYSSTSSSASPAKPEEPVTSVEPSPVTSTQPEPAPVAAEPAPTPEPAPQGPVAASQAPAPAPEPQPAEPAELPHTASVMPLLGLLGLLSLVGFAFTFLPIRAR